MRLLDRLKIPLFGKLLKDEATEERTFFALTILTGVAAGLVAVSLHQITYALTDWMGTNRSFDLRAFLLGGGGLLLSSYFTWRHFPSSSGSGIPGVRVALAVFHGRIEFKNTLAKYFTTIFSLSSGLSLGREGPTVAITSGIGSTLGSMFSLSKARIKALVAIGSAGGIAAAFHTPIAAVIFTLEEVVGDLNATKVLGPVIISAVVASVTAQMLLGGESHTFDQLHYTLSNPRELIIYLVLGIICAFLGTLWVRSVLWTRAINLKIFKHHKLTPTMVVFVIIAGISLVYPRVLGSGHDTIAEALNSLLLDWKFLAALFLFKFIATSLSYSTGASGGLFMPTLLMGAMLGALVGAIAGQLFPEFTENAGAYALVGMGAFFVAVIRTPFTSIIMVFEMTRNYNIILPLMIANGVSYILSNHLLKGSVYENLSEQDGIRLPTRDDNEVLESLVVEDAMVEEPITLNSSLTVKEAWEGVKGQEFSGYPLVRNGLLDGMISTNQLRAMVAKGELEKRLSDFAERKVITIHPDQSLLVAFHKLDRFQVSRLPVVSRLNDKRLIGIITAEDIVSKFGYHIKEEEKQEQLEKAVHDVIEEQREEHTLKT